MVEQMSTQERELYREASRGEVLRTVNSAFTEIASIPENQLSAEEKAARNYAVLMKEKTIDQGKVAAPHAAVTGRLAYNIDETVPVDTLLNLLQKKIDTLPPDSPQRNELVETQKKLNAFSVNLNRQLDDRLLNVRIQHELAAIEADPERNTGDHDQNLALAGQIINNRLQLELPKYVVYVGAQHEDIRKRAEHAAELTIENRLLELSKGDAKGIKRPYDWVKRKVQTWWTKSTHEYQRQKNIKHNLETLEKANFTGTNTLTEDAARQFNELRASGKATVERMRTGGVLGGEKVTEDRNVHSHLRTEINGILKDVVTALGVDGVDKAALERQMQERLHKYVETHQDSEQIKEFFGKNSNEYGDLSKFYATDILEMAEKINEDIAAHHFALDQLDQMVDIRLYRARWGEQTDTRTRVDKAAIWLGKQKLAPFLAPLANPLVIGAVSSLANIGFRTATSTVGRLAGITPIGAITGGVFSGLRRGMDYRRFRMALTRQAERGIKGAEGNDKVRKKLESIILPRMASASELINGGGDDLVTGVARVKIENLLQNPEANGATLLNRYAEIQARLDFSQLEKKTKEYILAGEGKAKGIGLIQYEGGNISQGMLELTKQMSIIKRALLNGGGMSSDDFDREKKRLVDVWTRKLIDVTGKSEKAANWETDKAVLKSAGLGALAGLLGQEGGALVGRAFRYRIAPTELERLAGGVHKWSTGNSRRFSEMALGGRWNKTDHVPSSLFRQLQEYRPINLDGYQILRDQDGTIQVFAEDAKGNLTDTMIARGTLNGTNLHFEQAQTDGSLAAEAAWKKLRDSLSVYDIGVEGETVVHETAVKVSEILKHTGAEQWADQFKLPTGEIVTADNHGNIGVFFPEEHKWLHGRITEKGTLLFDVNDPGNKGIDLAEVQKSLEGSGLKMSVTEGVGGEEVSVMDYFEKKGMVEKTERVGWWGYGQKGAQFNEKLFYFKLEKNGDIVLDISKMKPDHDELAQAMHQSGDGYTFEKGKFEILITPDAAANKAREAIALEIGTDGKLKIPKGSDVAQLFEVKDGVVKTKACFVEVAQNIEGGRRILSTVVGPGIEEIQAGGGGNGSLEISFPGSLNGEVPGLLKAESFTSFDVHLNNATGDPGQWWEPFQGMRESWSGFNDRFIPDENGWYFPVTVLSKRPFLMPPTGGSAETTATAAAGRSLPPDRILPRRERPDSPTEPVHPNDRFDIYTNEYATFINDSTPEQIATRFGISEEEARRIKGDEVARQEFLDQRAADTAALEYVYRQYELTRRPELDGMIKVVVDGLPEEQRRMHERHNAVHNRIVTRIYNEIRPNMTAEQRRTLEEQVRKEELDRANMNADQQTEYNEQYLPLAERIRRGVYDALRADPRAGRRVERIRNFLLRGVQAERTTRTQPDDAAEDADNDQNEAGAQPLEYTLTPDDRIEFERIMREDRPQLEADIARTQLNADDPNYLSQQDFITKWNTPGVVRPQHIDAFLGNRYVIEKIMPLLDVRTAYFAHRQIAALPQAERQLLAHFEQQTGLTENQRVMIGKSLADDLAQVELSDTVTNDQELEQRKQEIVDNYIRDYSLTTTPQDLIRISDIYATVVETAKRSVSAESDPLYLTLRAQVEQWRQEIEASQPAPDADQEPVTLEEHYRKRLAKIQANDFDNIGELNQKIIGAQVRNIAEIIGVDLNEQNSSIINPSNMHPNFADRVFDDVISYYMHGSIADNLRRDLEQDYAALVDQLRTVSASPISAPDFDTFLQRLLDSLATTPIEIVAAAETTLPDASGTELLSDQWKDYPQAREPGKSLLERENQFGPYRLAAGTDIGEHRRENQDTHVTRRFEALKENLLLLADGMGGGADGKGASELAANTFTQSYQDYRTNEKKGRDEALQLAMQDANKAVHDWNPAAGSTLVACVLADNGKFYMANIGDSRGYVMSDDRIVQKTKDHSLVARLVELGQISAEEVYTHPRRNEISRSLGNGDTVDTSDIIFEGQLADGDQILLCCDGLWEETQDTDNSVIHKLGRVSEDQSEVVRQSVAYALQQGGRDNVTVVSARKTS